MSLKNWFRSVLDRTLSKSSVRRLTDHPRMLNLEALEDRVQPAPLFLNTTVVSDPLVSIGNANSSQNVAVDPSGNIYVGVTDSQGVQVATSTNRGSSFATPVTVANDHSAVEVSLTTDPSGNLYVAWVESGSLRAYLSESSDHGATFSSPQFVGTTLAQVIPGLEVAVHGPNVYVQDLTGEFLFRNSNFGAGSFTQVTVAPGPDNYAHLGVDPTTGEVFSVHETEGALSEYFSIDGGQSFHPQAITGTFNTVYDAAAAFSFGPLGDFAILAGASNGTTSTDADQINLITGVTSSPASPFGSDTDLYGRSLAADSSGDLVDTSFNNGIIQYEASQDLGNSFAPTVTVDPGASVSANVAINPVTQDIVIAYQQGTSVFVNVYAGELTPIAPTTVYVSNSYAGDSLGQIVAAGQVFGVNAFATIQAGVTAVATNGTVDVYGSPTPETVALGSKNLTITGQTPNDLFDVSGWTGSATLNGASGGTKNTIEVAKNASLFTLTNSSLVTSDGVTSDGLNLTLGNMTFQVAWLSDTAGGKSSFDVSGWTGKGGLYNKSTTVGDSIIINKTVNVTLSNTLVTSGDGMSMSLSGLFNNASGTDACGGNTLTYTGWTGIYNVTNTGWTPDTLTGSKYANFTLTNAALTTSNGLTINMTGKFFVSMVTLGGNNTVNVSGYTGCGSISTNAPYSDTVIAAQPASFILTNSSLLSSLGLSMSLTNVSRATLTDTFGGDFFDVSCWTGSGSLTNTGSYPDYLTATKNADMVLSNTSLTSTDGMSMQLAGAGKFGSATLTGLGNGHNFTVSGWTGCGSITDVGTAGKVTAAKNASFTLSNGLLCSSDLMSMFLCNIGTAALTDTGGGHTFNVSCWTGLGSLTNSGLTADTLCATKCASFTLSKTLLTTTDGMSLTLSNIGIADLTDTGGGHTFTVTNWTGKGIITGTSDNSDRVIDGSPFTWSGPGTNLNSTNGMSLVLQYIASVMNH